ncbi:MAG: TrmH family RNA methyltransferase [Planctomycetota bacterium]|nr:TrmH family RNA methyltransferase [Planctomycetota bacterium]
MPRFEHLRHKPPSTLAQSRELTIVLAPMRSNVNLSRIVRLCGCAGIRTIIQCGSGKVDREIARDAVDVVEIIQRRSLLPVLEQLKRDNIPRIGLEQTTNSQNLFDYQFPHKAALVIGSEREGLSQEELDLLDAVIEIPVYGKPFSYNVATATTMAVYEYCRQFPS